MFALINSNFKLSVIFLILFTLSCGQENTQIESDPVQADDEFTLLNKKETRRLKELREKKDRRKLSDEEKKELKDLKDKKNSSEDSDAEEESDRDNSKIRQTSGEDKPKSDRLLGVPIGNNSDKVFQDEDSSFKIKSTASIGEWEILGTGGSGGTMKSSDIRDVEDQGFRYLTGGGSGDKNSHIFVRKKAKGDGDISMKTYANKVMYVYVAKTDSELEKLGINDLTKKGDTDDGSGSFDKGHKVSGLSFVTTDDGVKDVKCDADEILASELSHKGDGGFLIFGDCTFKADRNDSRGGRQLYSASYEN